jgi:hypothetical protein
MMDRPARCPALCTDTPGPGTGPRPIEDAPLTPARRFAQVAGTFYVSVAVLGFVASGWSDQWATSGALVLGLEVNAMHSLLHLLIGGSLLAGAAAGEDEARVLVLLAAGASGVLALIGPAMVGTEANVLALNPPDTLVHLATALLGGASVAVSRPSARIDEDARTMTTRFRSGGA